MHKSVMEWVAKVAPKKTEGLSVLEFGARNVNGTPRQFFEGSEYVGLDILDGDGVDVLLDATEAGEAFAGSADVVISTEMLEHAEDWRGAVDAMKACLKPDGKLILTTRGPGFGRHEYPGDYWRFTVSDMQAIFADMGCRVISDPQHPGVFVYAWKLAKEREPVDLSQIEVAEI